MLVAKLMYNLIRYTLILTARKYFYEYHRMSLIGI